MTTPFHGSGPHLDVALYMAQQFDHTHSDGHTHMIVMSTESTVWSFCLQVSKLFLPHQKREDNWLIRKKERPKMSANPRREERYER